MEDKPITVAQLISEFEEDSDIQLFQQRRMHSDIFKTLGLVNDENSYSNLIAWLFGYENNQRLCFEPIKRLFDLLKREIPQKDISLNDENALHMICMGNYEITSVKANREYCIKRETKKVKKTKRSKKSRKNKKSEKGYIDIFIQCSVDIRSDEKTESKQINIVIENKVLSDTQNNQLHRYKDNIDQKFQNAINLYVILAPGEVKEKHESYLKITYQDLVDYVIEPTIQSPNISTHTRILLEDFLYALISYNNKHKIKVIAMNKIDKQLLCSFYKKHKELITLMINMLAENPDIRDEMRSDVKETADALKMKKDRNKVLYVIVGEDKTYQMAEIVQEVLKRYLQKYPDLSYEELKERFTNRKELGCPNDFINDKEKDNRGKPRYKILSSTTLIDSNGVSHPIGVSSQWTKYSIKIFESYVNNKLINELGVNIQQIK